ncbi:hypothetical protein L6270_02610 [Candidatus Parcubacteria bacterium]|nr:hypothetical protein [Patescibacteria group bacterium]MBU4309916.1 hypothetical protein [Patescibacteria group bacterium]MBU4431808.1 hypothetical protein [Patescibacteria group bacterium]MBU4577841.1 hypothetical protein [Patescibacteria group bacterium]MCG2696902.1 hypothetical protein [Candidatus Parcubacteria bacterium]
MDLLFKYKKLLLAVGFLLTTILLGYLIYATFFKQLVSTPNNTTDNQATSTPTGSLPIANTGNNQPIIEKNTDNTLPTTDTYPKTDPIARGGITTTKQLESAPTIGAAMAKNGSDIRYYNKNDEKFYRLNSAGDKVLLSDKVFHNVQNVTWAGTQNKAVIEYPDGANIVYNFETKKQTTLPAHWKDFEFSPQGDKIVMKSIGLDENNRWLAISSDDGSQVRAIEQIGSKDASVYPSWSPNNQTIAMYTEGVGFDRQEVFFVGLNNENFKSLTVEGRDFQPKWSPNGDRLLYSVYSSANNLNPSLWISNAQGEAIGSGRKELNVATWAEKCYFANTSDVYCAVPEKLEEGSGLFPELANSTKDNLYKINTATGQKKLIAIPDGDYTIANITISQDERNLYFTDKRSENIYQVKL